MSQSNSFSGIVPALKEEIAVLKSEKTELEKKLRSKDEEIHRLNLLIDKRVDHEPIVTHSGVGA